MDDALLTPLTSNEESRVFDTMLYDTAFGRALSQAFVESTQQFLTMLSTLMAFLSNNLIGKIIDRYFPSDEIETYAQFIAGIFGVIIILRMILVRQKWAETF